MQFPERHNNHTLEQKSETFFRQYLPQDWNITIPNKDYGQDLNLEICEEGQYRGLDLIVQLKSSITSDILNGTERQQLKVSTYNYLSNNVRVVLIVKFIEDENEAYWTLLKDITAPANSDQENFTIYLPRQNKISTIIWGEITSHVREVTDSKLAAMRVANALEKLKLEVEELKQERDILISLAAELKVRFNGDWNSEPYPAQILSPVSHEWFLLFEDSQTQQDRTTFYATEQYQFTKIDVRTAEFYCRLGVKSGDYPLGQNLDVLENYNALNIFVPFVIYDRIKDAKIAIEEIEIMLHINGKTTKRFYHKEKFIADVKTYNNNLSKGWATVGLSSPRGKIMDEFDDK